MWFTFPNLFTMLRVGMTPLILLLLARGQFMAGGWLFGLAAFTDLIDGAVARKFAAESKVGLYLDPIADKLLLSSVYVGLALGGAVPAWLVFLIFARDLWIIGLSIYALRCTSFRYLTPSVWGKISTFLQVMTAVGVMAARAYHNQLFGEISAVLIWLVAVFAVFTAVDYSMRGIIWLRRGKPDM